LRASDRERHSFADFSVAADRKDSRQKGETAQFRMP